MDCRATSLLPLAAIFLTGCAGWLNSDIQKSVRNADLTIPNCRVDAEKSFDAWRIGRPSNVDISGIEALGLPDISAVKDTLAVGKIVLAAAMKDPQLDNALASRIGTHISRYIDNVPLMDQHSVEAAKRAHKLLTESGFLSGPGLDKKTLTRHEQESLLDAVGTATAVYGWEAELTDAVGGFVLAVKDYQAAYASARNAHAAGFDVSALQQVSDLRTKAEQSLLAVRERSTYAAYYWAYFRNGEIFDVKFDGKELQTKILELVNKNILDHGGKVDPDFERVVSGEIEAARKQLLDKLCKSGVQDDGCTILGAIGEQTFVTRAGKSYGFPGVSATFDPTANRKVSVNKLNTNEIVEDLLRVLVEATGDAVDPVPGDPNSTLCRELGVCAKAGDSRIEHANDVGDKTEAVTAQAVSVAVRGGWLFSLNNEAIANSLTVGVSVGARKYAERVAYALHDPAECRIPENRSLTVYFSGP